MGAVAGELADVAIVTSDNPRSEDPEAIIAEIVAGHRRAGRRASSADRRAAIELAVALAPRRATSSSSPARATSRARSSRAAARCRSTTSPSRGRRCVRGWSPEPRRRRRRARGWSRAAPTARRPGARGRSTRAHVAPGRPLRRAAPASTSTAARFAAAGARRPARGASSSARARGATDSPAGARPRRRRPAAALQALARAWRRELGARGRRRSPARPARPPRRTCSPAMLAPQRASSPRAQNLNTEIGLPLTILGAPEGTEVLVLEMAMRGAGPDRRARGDRRARRRASSRTSGRSTSSCSGTIEAIAAAKAELIAGLRPGGDGRRARRRAAARRRTCATTSRTVTFGPGGDVD